MENNENEVKQVANKSKIVPSYAKKETQEKDKDKKRERKLKSKITLIIVALILLLIIFGIGTAIYFIVDSFKYKDFEQYESKMKIYGFERMYDNKEANTSEKLTQSEALKMIISTCFNIYDISDFAPIENAQYDNEIWVKYAEYKGIIPQNAITKDNQNKKIKYIDFLTYLYNAKKILLEKKADLTQEVKIKDYNKYTAEQQQVIQDMVWNKIIDNDNKSLNGKANVFKGQANKLLINFAEKYNTITLNDQKINISEEKLPYNAEEYPYTLSNVKKEVYEKRYYFADELNSILPSELYVEKKEYFKDYVYKTETYLNVILNIDFNTINEETFKQDLNSVLISNVDDNVVKEYVEYVKQNKIKITGKATVQLPAIYFDGENLRVRTQLTYKIESANNLKNVLFADSYSKVDYEYKLGDTTEYIDARLDQFSSGNTYFIVLESIRNQISGQIKKLY